MEPVPFATLAATRPEALRERLQQMPATISGAMLGVSEVTGHYIAAAYYTDTGDTEQPDTCAELAHTAVLRAIRDCADFLRSCDPAVLLAYEQAGGTLARMGHDFWLTRNGHGAGFWDRDNLQVGAAEVGCAALGSLTLGDYLSARAKEQGECVLVSGDDGLLYLE